MKIQWLLSVCCCVGAFIGRSAIAGQSPEGPEVVAVKTPTGIQSNLDWTPIEEIRRIFAPDQMGSLGTSWYREVIHNSSQISNFVEAVTQAHRAGMKLMAVTMMEDEDFDSPVVARTYDGPDWEKFCGWPGHIGPLSQLNLVKYRERLTRYFDALRSANQQIDGIEVGNELDTVCFNADVPWGRVATKSEVKFAQVAYARYLTTTIEVVKNYFPQAIILPFAPANIPSAAWKGYHFNNALKFIADLKNLDGVNYLAQTQGVAIHIYPGLTQGAPSPSELPILDSCIKLFGKATPLWITEWGFERSSKRANQMKAFLRKVDSYQKKVPVHAAMYFAYRWGLSLDLVNPDGRLSPEASILNRASW